MRRILVSSLVVALAPFTLAQTGRITGSLTDLRGHALAGGTIHVEGDDALRATSDDRGAFDLTLPAGHARLVIERAGFCRVRTAELLLAPDARRSLPLALQPCASMTGLVLAAAETPRAGARVRIDLAHARPSTLRAGSEDEGSFTSGAIEVVTGKDGRFRIEGIPLADGYTLEVRHPEHPVFEQRLDLAGAHDPVSLRVQLPPGAEIRGAFKGSDDKPVADVEVVAIDLDRQRAGDDVVRSTSGNDGVFRMRQLAGGHYRLEVHPPSGVTQYRGPLELASGDTKDLGTLRVTPGVAITGRLVDRDHQPVAKVRVAALRRLGETLKRERTTTSDAQGAFALKGLAEGRYVLRVEAEDPFANTRRDDVPAPSRNVEIVVPRAGSITGRVTARGSVCSLERLRVRALNVDQPDNAREAGKVELLDAQQGTFRVKGLATGDVVVSATARDCIGARSRPVHVGEGPVADTIELVLADGLAIDGTVVDATSGTGVAGAGVALGEDAGDDVLTDGAGRFHLAGARAGQNLVLVRHPDFAPARAAVVLDAAKPEPVTITVTPGATAEGTVRLANGQPVAGTRVELDREGSARATMTGADGTYRFEHVPAGDVDVRRVGGGDHFDQLESKRASLVDGQSTTIDFTLGNVVEGRVTKAGLPLPGVRLTLGFALDPSENNHDIARNYTARSTWTDGDGNYRVDGVAPGPTTLTLAFEGQTTRRRVEIPDSPTCRLDVAAPARALSGVVVEERTANPIADASVQTSLPVTGLGRGWTSMQSKQDDGGQDFTLTLGGSNEDDTRSAADGTFTLWVDDGVERTVFAWAWQRGSGSVKLRPEDDKPLRIELKRAATLRVRPHGPAGEELSGVRACALEEVKSPSGGSTFNSSCTWTQPGETRSEFTFELSAGDAPEVLVAAPGFAVGRLQLPALRANDDGQPNLADVRLERGGSVIIHTSTALELTAVTGKDGADLRGLLGPVQQVETTPTSIRINGLPPGTFTFALNRGEPLTATVRAGETTEVQGP